MSKFLFGIHCHQPVDNFSYIVDRAIEKAYRPFIGEILKKSNIKIAVHFSGWLLEYIKERDRELFGFLVKLADDGRVEFFTGGYYEPVLVSIPSWDRIEQIARLSNFIRDNFGLSPRGLWLTERVYDESIIRDLIAAGIEYIVVDDFHFISAGFRESELYGYFVTEEGGNAIKVFPISKKLRYMIPFRQESEVFGYLGSIAGDGAAVIFDDGEKFGIWPGTYRWVYDEGWLERFLDGLGSVSESMHFGEYIDTHKPNGIAYLPSCSYYEMGQWSLRYDEYMEVEELKRVAAGKEHLLKGGVWKNFFVKYDESNRLHKRMLEMSRRDGNRSDEEFKDNLFRLQCNDVYWHGIFGGLYLPNLRDNAYRFLIKCENIAGGEPVEVEDNNLDGYREVKLRSEKLLVIFDERYSGAMTEFDLLDVGFNFQNTLTRRKEFYHEIGKRDDESGSGIKTIHQMGVNVEKWKDKIHYDWYVKNSFVDHFTASDVGLNEFERCTFVEYGDFANQPFRLMDTTRAAFERRGGIYKDGHYHPAYMRKAFDLEGDGIRFDAEFDTEFDGELIYLLEFNLHFANIKDIELNGAPFCRTALENRSGFTIKDRFTSSLIELATDKPFTLFVYPLNTVSQSEEGLNYINQGITVGCAFVFRSRCSIAGWLRVKSLEGADERI